MGYIPLGTWTIGNASSPRDHGSSTGGQGHVAGSGVSSCSLKATATSLSPSAKAEVVESFAQGGQEALLTKRGHPLSTFPFLQPFYLALQIAVCSDRTIPKSWPPLRSYRPALQSHPKVLRPICSFGTRWTRSTGHEEQPLCRSIAPTPSLQIGCAGTRMASRPAARLQNALSHEAGAKELHLAGGGGAASPKKGLKKGIASSCILAEEVCRHLPARGLYATSQCWAHSFTNGIAGVLRGTRTAGPAVRPWIRLCGEVHSPGEWLIRDILPK